MKRLLIIRVVVIVILGVVNTTLSGPIYLVNEFDIPDVPGAQFLSGSGIASDGTDLFILLRFTTSSPFDEQYTVININTSGELLATFDPFERGGCLTFHNGRLLRGHDPVPGITTTEIIIFDPIEGVELGTLPSPTTSILGGLTSDETHLFAMDLTKSIFVMDPDSGLVLDTFHHSLPGYGLGVGLAFSNGNLFATTWDTISMLNPSNGDVLDSFDPGIDYIKGMTFVNEELFVIGSNEKIYVYRLVPEPATLLLLGLGAVVLPKKRRV